MLDIRWTVIAIIALCCDNRVACAATSERVRTVDLQAAVNHTVCPIEVAIDEDPHREPPRIKLLKCAREPAAWCARRGVPAHECCAHRGPAAALHCVELHDQVRVTYRRPRRAPRSVLYDVVVGCTCMLHRAHHASVLPTPD